MAGAAEVGIYGSEAFQRLRLEQVVRRQCAAHLHHPPAAAQGAHVEGGTRNPRRAMRPPPSPPRRPPHGRGRDRTPWGGDVLGEESVECFDDPGAGREFRHELTARGVPKVVDETLAREANWLVTPMRMRPSHAGSTSRAMGTTGHGTATSTISAAAASCRVPAEALRPSSATSCWRLAGPRLLLSTT